MNKLPPFMLEEYFAEYEFTAPHLLCMSDCEPYSLQEILSHADQECQDLWDHLSLGYSQTQGLPQLREALAQQYTKVDRDDVLCHAGAGEAIYCAMQALLSKGDHVIVFSPCYQSLEALPRAIGCEITDIELDPHNDWAIDLNILESAIRPTTKMIIMNFPHNPTGALLSHEELQSIVTLARQNGCYLLCDEVYRLMEIDPADRLPAVADAYEKGISIGVMTKPFGLGGLRIGWVASQDKKMISGSAAYKHYTSICNATPSEVLALIALRNTESLLGRNRAIITSNLKLIDELFKEKRELLSWSRPKGGCTGYVKVDQDYPIEDLAKDLVTKSGVLILPGSVYKDTRNYFRIGFGRINMPDTLKRFKQHLNEFNR